MTAKEMERLNEIGVEYFRHHSHKSYIRLLHMEIQFHIIILETVLKRECRGRRILNASNYNNFLRTSFTSFHLIYNGLITLVHCNQRVRGNYSNETSRG